MTVRGGLLDTSTLLTLINLNPGFVYDSQVTNRKQGGLPVGDLLPLAAHLLVPEESYMTPSRHGIHKNITTNR
jgi:hypothetical protein